MREGAGVEVGGGVEAEGERGGGVAEEAAVAGGEKFGEATDEALAGGGVGDATGCVGGDGGFVVGGADVADVGAEDDGDGVQREGGVGGGAEFLGADVLEAGEGLDGARDVD